jgi:toxin-antitoxin system PIN domain toxin
MRSLFPDVNLWLALHHEIHPHHRAAVSWFGALDPQSVLVFCRQTQLGLFRLLTTAAVMENKPLANSQCWDLFATWIKNGKAELWNEPAGIDAIFLRGANHGQSSPKMWTDAYLAAFAEAGGLRLVTFDKALAAKAKGATLLR